MKAAGNGKDKNMWGEKRGREMGGENKVMDTQRKEFYSNCVIGVFVSKKCKMCILFLLSEHK